MSAKGINEMAAAVYHTAQKTCNPCSFDCSHPDCAGKPSTVKRRSVTDIANEIVNSERSAKYGPPHESFEKASQIVSAMLTKDEMICAGKGLITRAVVAKVMIALKLVREGYSPTHRDHLVDAAGYIDILDQVK